MKRLFVVFIVIFFISSNQAKASITFGEAALTVGASILVGGLLGASTLPFYQEPSQHKGNIGVGAAVGAVVGVVIATYSGISGQKEVLEQDDSDTGDTPPSTSIDRLGFAQLEHTNTMAWRPEVAYWSPITTIRF